MAKEWGIILCWPEVAFFPISGESIIFDYQKRCRLALVQQKWECVSRTPWSCRNFSLLNGLTLIRGNYATSGQQSVRNDQKPDQKLVRFWISLKNQSMCQPDNFLPFWILDYCGILVLIFAAVLKTGIKQILLSFRLKAKLENCENCSPSCRLSSRTLVTSQKNLIVIGVTW